MKTIKIVLVLLVIACCMYVDYEDEYYIVRFVGSLVFVVVGCYMISNDSKKRMLARVLVGLGFLFHEITSQVVEMVLGSVLWYVVIIAITTWLIILIIRDR